MSKISLSPSPTGSAVYTIASPAGSTDRVLTLPDATATLLTNAGGTLTGGLTMGGQLNLGSTGQIVFPATQSASANANTLDDYEEGTWTPELRFGGGTTGITYSARSGRYVKIGNFVQAQFRLSLSNKGSSTGEAQVFGLPFPPRDENGAASYGFINSAVNNVTWTNYQLPTLDINVSYVYLRYVSGGTFAGHTQADFNNNTDIIVSVSYIGY